MKKWILFYSFLLVGISISAQTEMETKLIEVKGVFYALSPIKGGTFTMGADKNAQDDIGKYNYKKRMNNEEPARQVTLSDFWMGQTEVTRALWQAVMGKERDRSYNTSSMMLPVHNVTWKEAKEFCEKLGKIIGEHVRLPTEAEWEYVYRGGSVERDFNGGNKGWLDGKLHGVAQKDPNVWLIYDMLGNVFEWCEDRIQNKYHPKSPVTNPVDYRIDDVMFGAVDNWGRVVRGSCYSTPIVPYADYLRSCYRWSKSPDNYERTIGFRIVIPSKEMEKKMTVYRTTQKQKKRGNPAVNY